MHVQDHRIWHFLSLCRCLGEQGSAYAEPLLHLCKGWTHQVRYYFSVFLFRSVPVKKNSKYSGPDNLVFLVLSCRRKYCACTILIKRRTLVLDLSIGPSRHTMEAFQVVLPALMFAALLHTPHKKAQNSAYFTMPPAGGPTTPRATSTIQPFSAGA
jgi:hypothetical protein